MFWKFLWQVLSVIVISTLTATIVIAILMSNLGFEKTKDRQPLRIKFLILAKLSFSW